MNALVIMLALPLASAATPRQNLEVVADAATVTPLQWSEECGSPPKTARLPKGTQMQLLQRGTEWQLVIGNEAVFGTDVCSGINPTLEVQTQRREGDEWFISCKSKRMVKATETTETYLRKKSKGRVEVQTKSTRHLRNGQVGCQVVLERQTLFMPPMEPDPEDEPAGGTMTDGTIAAAPLPVANDPDEALPTEDIVDDVLDAPLAPAPGPQPAPHVVQKPLSAGEQAQIESEIQRAIRKVERRNDVAPLQVVHENRMSGDFLIVERHYVLDGKALGEEDDKVWGVLQRRALTEIHDDVAAVGVHVLEVEFVYKTEDGARLRLKDAVFFDVTAEEAMRLKIASVEEGHFFTPLAERPKILFEINGQPYVR